MKKIVIHCASGIKNSGDEAILDVLVKEFYGKYDITVISLDAEYTKKMHPGIGVIDNKDKNWKKAVEDCDIFILGGGGLLQDTTTIYNVSRWLTKLQYAIRLHKKTMVFANSFEPLKFKVNAYLIKKWLKQVDVVTVRDAISLRVLQRLGISQAVLTADPVFGYEKTAVPAMEYPENYVTVSIRHWYDTHPFIPVGICNKLGIRTKKNQQKYEQYIRELAKVVDWLNIEKKMPAYFLCFCIGRDAKVAEDILSRVRHREMNKVINETYQTPTELMEYIGHSRLLICMRLHSLIYACIEKTPMAILSYQTKVRGMAKALRLSDSCIEVDHLNAKRFAAIIEPLLEKENSQKRNIEVYARRMAALNRENFKYFYDLLGEKDDE